MKLLTRKRTKAEPCEMAMEKTLLGCDYSCSCKSSKKDLDLFTDVSKSL